MAVSPPSVEGGLPREPLPFPPGREGCSLLAFHLLGPPPPLVFFFGVTEQAHFEVIRDSSSESGPASWLLIHPFTLPKPKFRGQVSSECRQSQPGRPFVMLSVNGPRAETGQALTS